MFRARLLRGLRGLVQQGVVALADNRSFAAFERSLPPKERWVVHAQAPFGRFEHVLAYLGRYTHRVGISNARLRAVSNTDVTFATRDGKTSTLLHRAFALRFLQHVLPHGFKKIRHYGLYASGSKQRAIALAALQPTAEPPASHTFPTEAATDVTTGHSLPTEAAIDAEPLPSWRERCCPHCSVNLLVVAQIPRPACSSWRPP